MGGQAFANHPSQTVIHVPRMPPDVYQSIADDVGSKLKTLFLQVTIPREAPGKLDYGDIDFLVEGIRSENTMHSNNDIWRNIRSLLGAELHVSRGGAHSFGIRHPNVQDAYVQVDVEISPGNGTPDAAELFKWTKFMKGDSDLLQIIGICHRPLGLTCNDRGLHVRVEEIEPYNKKKSLLFLTRDPNKAMELYGLDAFKYWAGFQNESDMFEWISQGQFFSWDIFNNRVEKSNDRSRQSKRPMYRNFVEVFMPAHREGSTNRVWSRTEVLHKALDMFDVHDQYQTMMAEHNSKEAEEALWKQIKDALPTEGASLGLALKGLKRWVAFADSQPYISTQPLDVTPVWTEAISLDSIDHILKWVLGNWQEVKRLEQKRAKEFKEAATSYPAQE